MYVCTCFHVREFHNFFYLEVARHERNCWMKFVYTYIIICMHVRARAHTHTHTHTYICIDNWSKGAASVTPATQSIAGSIVYSCSCYGSSKGLDCTSRARTNLIEALLMCIGPSNLEPKIIRLCPANAEHWQSVWGPSSCPHFQHWARSERVMIWRCYPVCHLVTSPHCFLSKGIRFLNN
jgi:hypothetical protein